jgi:hypothetical protein
VTTRAEQAMAAVWLNGPQLKLVIKEERCERK